MRILGIDPGVATVGFGVIEAQAGRQQMIQYGAITTPAGQPLAARLVPDRPGHGDPHHPVSAR